LCSVADDIDALKGIASEEEAKVESFQEVKETEEEKQLRSQVRSLVMKLTTGVSV
jgi:hypothetical protein